ncbi:MAG: cell division protein ZapA [Firmicutes bacterium]|nr:cell division protein ZapA [Bacillota bacterium]
MEPNKTNVKIDGKDLSLIFDDKNSEFYVQKIAAHIDKKIKNLRSLHTTQIYEPNFYLMLALLEISDEYFKLIEKNVELQELQNETSVKLQSSQSDNKELVEQIAAMQTQISDNKQKYLREIKDLQAKLATSEAELREYIATFDAIQRDERRNVVSLQESQQNNNRKAVNK